MEVKKFKVRFTVTFETEVECLPFELADEISNLNIPEDDQTKYVEDTFEFESAVDSEGNSIDLEGNSIDPVTDSISLDTKVSLLVPADDIEDEDDYRYNWFANILQGDTKTIAEIAEEASEDFYGNKSLDSCYSAVKLLFEKGYLEKTE